MPKVVQTRLDLPVRKTRSGVATPSKKLLSPLEDPEKKLRTPRRAKKDACSTPSVAKTVSTPSRSPSKRVRNAGDGADLEKLCQVSPSKQKKLTKKENVGAGGDAGSLLSPSTRLSRLAINSPRPGVPLPSPAPGTHKSRIPLSSKKTEENVAVRSPAKLSSAKKGGLFSPQKLTAQGIEDLVCSPEKQLTKLRTPVKKSTLAVNNLAPAKAKTPLPAKSPCRQSLQITPTKSLFGHKPSPQKFTSQDIEDLLCSPVKIEPPKPFRSPRKAATPIKNIAQGAPNASKLLFSPTKPKTPLPPKSPKPRESLVITPTKALFQPDVSHYQKARQALHTSSPRELLCRESQVKSMSDWLDSHLVDGKPGSLYVSGAPGTGKTATLNYLLETKTKDYKSIFINCMVLKSSVAIYREVAKALNPKSTAKSERDAIKVIETAIVGSGEMILLVLDEVDQLDSKNQEVLYTVFEWPALSGSRLALVGIANALDLTDRILPRLQVRDVYKPTLLHYPPYTKQQIVEIINKRLQDASDGGPPVIAPRAVTFLAGKISSLTGDLRKALDVCRRALEVAEIDARKQTLLKPMTARGSPGLASPGASPRKGYKTARPAVQLGTIDLKEIMKVVNQVYGSQVTASLGGGGGDSSHALPLQQKLLVASLLLMVKKGKSKEVTLGKLMETYTKVCKKRRMGVADESACVGMCEMLESRGLVTYKRKVGIAPRLAKISLRMDEDEVAQAMQDKTLLAAILEDVSCLAK